MIYPWVKSRDELSSQEQLQFRDAGPGTFISNPRAQAEKSCKDWVGEFSCKINNMIQEGQCGTSGFDGKGGGSYCEPGGIITWTGYYQMKDLVAKINTTQKDFSDTKDAKEAARKDLLAK